MLKRCWKRRSIRLPSCPMLLRGRVEMRSGLPERRPFLWERPLAVPSFLPSFAESTSICWAPAVSSALDGLLGHRLQQHTWALPPSLPCDRQGRRHRAENDPGGRGLRTAALGPVPVPTLRQSFVRNEK